MSAIGWRVWEHQVTWLAQEFLFVGVKHSNDRLLNVHGDKHFYPVCQSAVKLLQCGLSADSKVIIILTHR